MTSPAPNENREQELAALLEISRVLASNVNLRDLVQAVLEQLRIVIDYTGSSVVTFVDGGIEIVESMGPDGREEEMVGQVIETPDDWDLLREVRAGGTVSIPDIMADEPRGASFRRVFAQYMDRDAVSYIRSWICVPLPLEDRVVGMLSLSHKEPGFFTQRHIDLVQLVARQAAVAAENARLFERTQSQTRELAALLEVTRALSSTLELQPLLELILDRLKEIVPYDGAAIMLGEGGVMRQLAVRRPSILGVSDEPDSAPRETRSDNFSVMWQRVRRGEHVIIDDVWGDTVEAKEYRNQWGGDLRGTRVEYVHSFLNVSLTVRGEVTGVVSLGHSTPGFYHEEHARLVSAFADQAGLAIENARLFEDAESRARESAAMLEVSRALTSTLELEPLMELVLDEVKGFADYAAASVSLLRDGRMEQLATRRPRGPVVTETNSADSWPAEALIDAALKPETDGALIIDDIRSESAEAADYRERFETNSGKSYSYARSLMTMPLVARGVVVGMLSLAHEEPGYFQRRHAKQLRPLASQAAVAIDNARLFEDAESRARELAAMLDVALALTSTVELRPLMELVLDRLYDFVPYAGASVNLLSGDGFVQLAVRRPRGPPVVPEDLMDVTPVDAYGRERLESSEALLIDDVHGDTPDAIAYKAHYGGDLRGTRVEYIHSFLSLTLLARGNVVGVLSIAHEEPGFFNESHVELLRPLASQAAVVLDNARLFDQAESRARELAVMLEVSLALTSTIELRPLMELVLDRLYDFVPYAGASVSLVRDDSLVQVALRRPRGPEVVPEDLTRAMPLDAYGKQSLMENEALLIEDVHGDSDNALAYRAQYGGDLSGTRVEFIHSYLSLPLLARGDVVGVLSISHEDPGFFKQAHVELLRPLASQAAVVIENARLFDQAELRARETEALLRGDEELFRSLDLDDVFQALANVAVDLLGADKGIFWVWDAKVGRLMTRASRNFSPESVAKMQSASAHFVPDSAPTRVIVEEDVTENAEEPWREILSSEGIVRWAEVTLVTPGGPVLGSFAAGYTSNHVLSENERRVFVALGERAAMAISNAELHGRAQKATALEERQRLARELHDSVSQALYGIALGARTARTVAERDPSKLAEPLDYVLSLAEAGLAEMRALIFELRPESLETEGLVAALEKQVAATGARYGIAVTAELGTEPDVPLDAKECLYRIGQEALHNMVKHANATEATVTLRGVVAGVELIVKDNGQGFDTNGDFAGHLGLRSMRERCAKIGGEVDIQSKPGAGTTIRALVRSR